MEPDEAPASSGPRKILIVDDHGIFREGLAKLIEQDETLVVCGQAKNATEALDQVQQVKPDLAVVDISLEGASGLDLTRGLRAQFPELRILVLSMHEESVYGERALRTGANGYIMKQESGTALLEAIHAILHGQTYISKRLNQLILQGIASPDGETKSSLINRLGVREFEVFRLIAKGRSARQIAEDLGISIKTVEAHREHIRDKLNLPDTSTLVQYAQEWRASEKLSI